MRISLSWLGEFVDLPSDLGELKTCLTKLGLGVQSTFDAGEDTVLDVEVTTNRPDCLSHHGTAREIAAAYRIPLKQVHAHLQASAVPATTEVSVEILNPDLCARYCARVITNVQVKSSPAWMGRRLQAVGMRPINNVADVTNYVLMALGQPLHAFDLSAVRGGKIQARRAAAGERLKTLDGVDRVLAPTHLVIADAERALALAGVMGGEESEITTSTRSVLLESAWFDPVSIRRTAKAQGLHTEASHRFERGADIEMAPLALDLAAALIAGLADGQVLNGATDVYPRRQERPHLVLRQSEIERILGTRIPEGEVERILQALGFEVEVQGAEVCNVTPPSFRLDVTREVNLIEEVARHVGYDRLPSRVVLAPPRPQRNFSRQREAEIAETLVSLGYHQIITSSMIAPAENAKFSQAEPVVIENPLSQESSELRTTPLPGMLAALRWNLDRDQDDLRFFEIGKGYWRNENGKPYERRVLALGLMGRQVPPNVHGAAREIGFFDLKGDLDVLFEQFDLPRLRFSPTATPSYEPGLAGTYEGQAGRIAVFGRLAGQLAREYKLRAPAWIAEVDLELVLEMPERVRSFKPFSKFPAVVRDFSLTVPSHIEYARITGALREAACAELASFAPVDLFRGGTVDSGHYSLLLRVKLESIDHTLTGEEITSASRKLLDALAVLGIHLRGEAPA
jgi:phenylalanyl-tRNA synthetase beta chain